MLESAGATMTDLSPLHIVSCPALKHTSHCIADLFGPCLQRSSKQSAGGHLIFSIYWKYNSVQIRRTRDWIIFYRNVIFNISNDRPRYQY